MTYKPGQYLTFWFEIPGHPPVKRNYSISAAPNDETYRISVKREPQGLASGWLHDSVDVGTVLKVAARSEEHTSELQSLMRISYAVFCLKKKKNTKTEQTSDANI